MLRIVFVSVIIVIGLFYAAQGAFWSLLFYLWLAYFRPEQWIWIDSISWLNLSLVIGVWTVLLLLLSPARLRFDLRTGLLGLFLVQSLVSVLFSAYSAYSWPFWIEFAKVVVIAYVISVLTTDPKHFRLVLVVIGLSLGFEGAKQGWAQLILNPGGVNENEVLSLGDNNGVAVGMLMLVPILTTVASTAAARWQRLGFQFLAVGVVYRAISTYSRGGFLAALALGLVYILRSPRRVPALAGIVLASAIILPALPSAFWNRMSTIQTPGELTESSAVARLHFWHVATLMANQNPIAGVGHNAYNRAYNDYDDTRGAYGANKSVHSVWFGVVAELGYPGLLLLLAQLLLAFGSCVRARKAAALEGAPPALGRFAFAIEASLVVFAVGGAFIPFQYTEMSWHVIGLSIGLNNMSNAVMAQQSRPPLGGWADRPAVGAKALAS